LIKTILQVCVANSGDVYLLFTDIFLQRICLALPDAFISPRTWMAHSELLRQVLTEDVLNNSTGHAESLIRDVHQTLLGDFFDIKKRNEAMLFCNLPTRGTARLGGVVADIQVTIMLSRICLADVKPASQLDLERHRFGDNTIF
jgi:hypothetical protein